MPSARSPRLHEFGMLLKHSTGSVAHLCSDADAKWGAPKEDYVLATLSPPPQHTTFDLKEKSRPSPLVIVQSDDTAARAV